MKSLLFHSDLVKARAISRLRTSEVSGEEVLENLAFLAAQICQTSMSGITLVDEKSECLQATFGVSVESFVLEKRSLCHLCMEEGDILVLPDTLTDSRSQNLSSVQGYPFVRFYAGIPLKVDEKIIGVLYVADSLPGKVNQQQLQSLEAISRLVIKQLENQKYLLNTFVSTKPNSWQTPEALRQKHGSDDLIYENSFENAKTMGVIEVVGQNILFKGSKGRKGSKGSKDTGNQNVTQSINQKNINQNITNKPKILSQRKQDRLLREIGISVHDLKEWIHDYSQTEHNNLPISNEYELNTANGKKCFRVTICALDDDSLEEKFTYFIEDITNNNLAQEKLVWQETLLRSMTNISPLAFYAVDNSTNEIIFFNQQFCQMWGIEHLQKAMKAGKLNHLDMMSECNKFFEHSPFSYCQPLPDDKCICEDEISLPDGRTIRRFSKRISHDNGEFGRLYILEDITVRKQNEQHLREQAALLDISTDTIILRDLSNKILLWNNSAEALYGWKEEEVLGKDANQVLRQQSLNLGDEVAEIVLNHGFWQGELKKINKHGQEIIVESRWTLVKDDKGNPKSILVVDTDITHKKQLEKQFLRAQRMESIGTLASGIAHDLNNVLSPILMSAQFLRSKFYDETTANMLAIVENNAKRGANLVKQVLLFARGMEGDRTILQVKDLILEMSQIIEQTFPKSMQVEIKLQPSLCQIRADHTQIHQVLMNLCLNARDAMNENGTLIISAENILIDESYAQMYLDAQVGNYVLLTVEDTGIGIPNDQLDRIFEPFFTTKEFGQGTGLGLSTVMGIIKGHNGFVNVSSTPYEGTKFQVYLPTVDAVDRQIIENNLTPRGLGEWILVVDDETAIREITKTSLEGYNYQVMTAADGIEAVATYAQHRDKISAVIIDMMMPNMNGTKTIQTLQKMNSELKIIAVSGLATSEQLPIKEQSCAPLFLSKPYTAHELLKKLYYILHT
ncbi:MAG: PAS domain S-box protein [Cyanobacteria bacterium P01_A01_bin.84]